MMNSTIEKLNEQLKALTERHSNFHNAMNDIAKIEIEDKQKIIDNLRTKSKEALDQKQLVMNAISALQKVCEHRNPDGSDAFISAGHDSHYSYEKCSICGHEEKC